MTRAVLTGDIIESTRISAEALELLFAELHDAVTQITPHAPDVLLSRRGGDGWQMAFGAALDLRLSLYISARLQSQGAATRIAVARGKTTLPANGDLNAAHGMAFTASGRLLGQMKDQRLDHAAGGHHAAAFRLAGHIAQGWTKVQAQTIAPLLLPKAGPRAKVAVALGKSRQAVDQALNGAGFAALMSAIEVSEQTPAG